MKNLFIKNDQSLKKWNAFKKRKPAIISIWLILIFCFFSFTAEFWANSKPIYLKHKGESFFPVFKDYQVDDFGIKNTMTVDYRKIKLLEGDVVIWPIIKWDPYETNKEVDSFPSPPSKDNLMGTDDRGRDVLTRLLYGLRYSIIYAIAGWMISLILGTIIGGTQGFLGGRVDLYGQRVTEVLSAVPQLLLLIIIISIFQPSMFLLIIVTNIFSWIGISYYMRGEFLKNRKREYVEAARSIGASNFRIFFKHILPNSLGPVITFSPFMIAGNITALASLDYLGFGLTPPTPSWGELLAQAQNNFTIGWWLALFPSISLFSVLTMFSLVGEGVRDAMDPYKVK
jgi:microcin C transport system permease protein